MMWFLKLRSQQGFTLASREWYLIGTNINKYKIDVIGNGKTILYIFKPSVSLTLTHQIKKKKEKDL